MNEPVQLTRTGIQEIDEQHAQLVACLDELRESVGGTGAATAAQKALDTLFDYTRRHFAFEEELLAQLQYPYLADHIAGHQTLIADLAKLGNEVASGKEIGEQLVLTLRVWILNHINSEDMKYARYLVEA